MTLQNSDGKPLKETTHTFSHSPGSTTVRFLIAFALLALILVLPRPPDLSMEGQRVLAIVAMAIGLWTGEAAIMAVNALIIIVMLVLTKGIPLLAVRNLSMK